MTAEVTDGVVLSLDRDVKVANSSASKLDKTAKDLDGANNALDGEVTATNVFCFLQMWQSSGGGLQLGCKVEVDFLRG